MIKYSHFLPKGNGCSLVCPWLDEDIKSSTRRQDKNKLFRQNQLFRHKHKNQPFRRYQTFTTIKQHQLD